MDARILGGYQTDFARNITREGGDFAELTREVVDRTLAAARVSATDIGVIHVGNAFGELFAGQASRRNAGHGARWALGHPRDTARGRMRVGQRRRAGRHRGPAFRRLRLRTGRRRGVGEDGTRRRRDTSPRGRGMGRSRRSERKIHVAVHVRPDRPRVRPALRLGREPPARDRGAKLSNARKNPNAQTRDWQLPDLDGDANPVIEGQLRRFDCSQITYGGAGFVLVSDDFLRAHRDAKPAARILGWGHRTVGLGLRQKLDRSVGDPSVLPHLRATVQDAFDRAGITLDDIDGFEVHDCFTPSEYLAIDHICITAPGESWKAVESGDIAIGGRWPINPSGGLIGGGHPVGASGVRMLVDAARQVSDSAGDYQVEGARRSWR
jgi:acetyl-CoA C-acetyltransferase